MSSRLQNIRRTVSATRWAIVPEKLEAILEVLETRAALGRPFTEAEIAERMSGIATPRFHAAANLKTQAGKGKVAILPLTGIIAPKSSMVNGESMPAGTGCDAFGAAFDRAMADDSISAIVFDVDSPGGSVDGVPELAAKIFSARGKKPMCAVANGMACSAAYFIASAADEITVVPSGEVGSIGVFMVHQDASQYFADMGVQHTIIKAGEYKAEGNPYEPLSDDGKAYLQSQVDEFYGMFVGAVARQRGISAADVKANYGQGRSVLARAALKAGMVDRIATFDQALARYGVSTAAYNTAKASAEVEDLPMAAGPIASLKVHIDASEAMAVVRSAIRKFEDEHINTAGVAATEVPITHEPQPGPRGQENTVPEQATASPGGAAPNADEIRATERRRVQEISTLCKTHEVDDANVVAAMIDRGITLEQAKSEVLDLKREQYSKGPRIAVGDNREGNRAFASLGDQLMAVIRAGKGVIDPRLQRFAGTPSGMNESVGSEGGFLIAPDFLPGLTKVVFADDPILSRVKRIPSAKNIVKYNVLDETSRATGSRSGGVQVYWVAEADTATAKKPKLREMVLEKKKIMGLAYLTEELQEDAPAAQAIVSDAFSSELTFVIANAVFRGTGAGQPLGFLNSGATASVTIEGSQTIANTAQSIAINTSKMMARVPASLWGDVIWLYNQELLPKLAVATIGSSGAVPVFMGAGGMSGKPYDTIWGRPAFASELCEAEGTVGDIICIAPSQYAVLGGDQTRFSESVHVRFLNDENVLKFTTRVDGAPEWVSTITRFKGGSALSPFVTLGTRS